ncbi:hypothetical protein CUU66_20655 [Peribacillus deserti]|uniref:Uncharacterized protein n=1 Tax=Peribacillus deserti TaxID=673318 RepID=A0A2N5M124_9BACI|nr:hypothetical protein CUU66_20655 [Peribacillus deserti]
MDPWVLEIFLFWYWAIIFWLLLFLSVIIFFVALKLKSWKCSLISLIVFIPNVMAILLTELEKVMYLFLLWFLFQGYVAFRLIKKHKT